MHVCVCVCVSACACMCVEAIHFNIDKLSTYVIGMCSDVPAFPFKQVRNHFKFLSLLTSKEAIEALNHVRAECDRVATIHLFHHSGVTKHLRLEEFQQAQSQATMMVRMYIITCVHTQHAYVRTYVCVAIGHNM